MTPKKQATIGMIVGALIFLGVFLFALIASAALTDNFDSYNDGDLNGQGSWSGNTEWDVSATYKNGASGKGAGIDTSTVGSTAIEKTFTAEATGNQIFYVNIVSESTSADFYSIFRSSSTNGPNLRFEGGNIQDWDGTTWQNRVAYSTNTWYKVEVIWDCGDDTYDWKVDDGTLQTTGVFQNDIASVDTLVLETYNAGAGKVTYVDDIGGIAAADTCTCPTDGTDWYVDSDDECYLTANCDLDDKGLFLLWKGSGFFAIIDNAILSLNSLNTTSTPVYMKAGVTINFK